MSCACEHPKPTRRASRASARARAFVDPVARMGAIGAVDAGLCDAGPFGLSSCFGVFPAQVTAAKKMLAPKWESVDVAVQSCASLAPERRALWNSEIAAWREFAAQDVGMFGSAGDCARFCAFARTLDAMIGALKECNISVPELRVPEADTSAIKWVVAGAIAIAAAVVVVKVL